MEKSSSLPGFLVKKKKKNTVLILTLQEKMGSKETENNRVYLVAEMSCLIIMNTWLYITK